MSSTSDPPGLSPPPLPPPPPPREKDKEMELESSVGTLGSISEASPESPPPSAAAAETAAASQDTNTDTNFETGCNSAAISTDRLCLGQMWSQDDDSVYTEDGIGTPNGKGDAKQATNKRSPSLLANEPLDFGSIFRTIHAMRCPQPQQPGDKNDGSDRKGGVAGGAGAGRNDDTDRQQGQQEDQSVSMATSSALDSSFAYDDTDADSVVSSTEKGCETRLSYTRSFLEQMISDTSCASTDSISNLGVGQSDSKKLNVKSPSPVVAGKSSMSPILGSSLALDLTTTDEDDDEVEEEGANEDSSMCDASDAFDVQSSTHDGYGDSLYDEESNANMSMMSILSVKTPVTRNGAKRTKPKNTGPSNVVDQLEDVTDSESGTGAAGDTSVLKASTRNISFGNDKEAWLYLHRRKVFLLLGLLVIIFGLVIAVMVLTRGDGSTPSAEASAINSNNGDRGFKVPDNYNGGTIGQTNTSSDPNSSSTNNTIMDIMVQLNLTTFPTALLNTGTPVLLLDTAQGSLQTVFAPSDSAFADALSAGVIKNSILNDKEWGMHLDKLLRHHIVLDSMLLTDQLEERFEAPSSEGQQQYLTMGSGEKVVIDIKTVDGTHVLELGKEGEVSLIEANVKAENGVVHVVNGLLRPKFLSMTVMDVLEQKQNLSTFVRLLALAGLDDELGNVDTALTIFAPNNAAFEALQPMTLTLLQSDEGREVLKETLQRHLLSVVLPTTNDIVPLGTTTKLAGTELLLKKDLSGVMSINEATFTARDALAVNGIVHSIGSVLLSTSAPTPSPALEISCGNFTCPQNMQPKSSQDCQESIDDCQCIVGYEMRQNGSCVLSTSVVEGGDDADDADDAPAVEKLCNFQCPNNAKRRENRQCWTNMNDCYCITGYQKSGNTCIQTNADEFVKRCMYTCPPKSSNRPNRNCIESFDDCMCDPGTIRFSIGCI